MQKQPSLIFAKHFLIYQSLSHVIPHLINWTVLEMRNFQAQRIKLQRHSCRLPNPNLKSVHVHHLIWILQFHFAYKPYFVHWYKDTWGYTYHSWISTQLSLLTIPRHLPHCDSSFCVIAISLLWAPVSLPRLIWGTAPFLQNKDCFKKKKKKRRTRTVSVHSIHDEQGTSQREKRTDSCTPRVGGNIHGTWEELEEWGNSFLVKDTWILSSNP